MTTGPSENGVLAHSVQERPGVNGMPGSSLLLNFASAGDHFPAWGTRVVERDKKLREFYPTEPILASAIYALTIRNAAFDWQLEGPDQTVAAVQQVMNAADFGAGWQAFMVKVVTDYYTQDNGAFIEVIRTSDSPASPVVGLAHLDAGRCQRTGDPAFPVIYSDRKSLLHKLASHQVSSVVEFPSPIETMNGMQMCAISRVLRAAQVLRDISVYQHEKISGNNPNAVYLVSGVQQKLITDAISEHQQNQTEKGFARYVVPLIVASLDPTQTVSVAQIDLKSLPDGFDPEVAFRWYINNLALGFGADYQDFAPLPGRNIGSSAQSLVLHEKSSGRGPAHFMKNIETIFNYQGLIPRNVIFRYEEIDNIAAVEAADLKSKRGKTIDEHVAARVLTIEVAQQIMLDEGLLTQEQFDLLPLPDGDQTDNVVAIDEEPVSAKADHKPRRRRRKKPKDDEEDKAEHEAEAAGVEEASDFGEEQRVEAEIEWADALTEVFHTAFDEAVVIMTKEKQKWVLVGSKQDPLDIFTDDAFWEAFRTQTLQVSLPIARDVATGAAELNASLGLVVDMDFVSQQLLDFTATYQNEWWNALEATTRDRLRSAITSWQESGLGTRGFPDLVKSIEGTFGRARAETIAATEVTRMFDEGNRLAHISAGIEIEEWQTVRDARVDDICRDLDRERFPTNSGPRPVTGTHIGCRCARLPVSAAGDLIGGR